MCKYDATIWATKQMYIERENGMWQLVGNMTQFMEFI